MRNTSLDEFLDADEGTEPGVGDERAESDPDTEPGAGSEVGTTESVRDSDDTDLGDTDVDDSKVDDSNTDPVEPAVATYDWTPSGAECGECGAVVERRWRDDAGLVCPDCKTW